VHVCDVRKGLLACSGMVGGMRQRSRRVWRRSDWRVSKGTAWPGPESAPCGIMLSPCWRRKYLKPGVSVVIEVIFTNGLIVLHHGWAPCSLFWPIWSRSVLADTLSRPDESGT